MSKQKRKQTRSTDSIPTPTYKNIKMFGNIRNQQMGSNQPITKNDSLVYKQGFDFGLRHQGGMKNPPANENLMYRAGRWEGQNTGKAINFKEATRPSVTTRFKNALKDFFND